MSALLRIPDSSRTSREVRKVPTGDRAHCLECNGQHVQKSRRRRLLNSNLLMVDHAAINAGFDLRRYAMLPMPAKPRIIMAHVDGSGTPPTTGGLPIPAPASDRRRIAGTAAKPIAKIMRTTPFIVTEYCRSAHPFCPPFVAAHAQRKRDRVSVRSG
jgi:hypothetical protein